MLQKRTVLFETSIKTHLQLTSLSTTKDLENLDAKLKETVEARQALDSMKMEHKLLLSKIQDLQQIQELDAKAKTDLFQSMQRDAADKDLVRPKMKNP